MDEKLAKLIGSIYQEANRLFQNQLQTNILDKSLKKARVSEIEFSGYLFKYIQWYRSELSSSLNGYAHQLLFMSEDNFDISYRVKAANSIIYKIQRYKEKGPEDCQGKYALAKVLNDIAGFRVIMRNPPRTEELLEYTNEVYQTKLKVINSDKYEYRAVHVYTNIDNRMLPWELQIWDSENETSNYSSHHKYKQDYVKWEEQHKDIEI